MINRVQVFYAAVFPVPVSEDWMEEAILAGFRKDPNMPDRTLFQATVVTHVEAIPELVKLCDDILEEQKEVKSYRLLKFDKDGIHNLNPDDFRTFERKYANVGWGSC